MKTFLLLLFWGVLAAVTLVGVLATFDGDALSLHGWVAMTIGTVLSVAVAVVLMWLLFYSARRGFDGRVPHEDGEEG